MKVKIKLLHPEAKMPEKQHQLDAGFDLFSVEDAEFHGPGEIVSVSCGFSMELPPGYEAQIRPRSGLAFQYGVTVINSPGTIDSNFRGEVKVGLVWLGGNNVFKPHIFPKGNRIAQMVIQKLPDIELEEAEVLSDTDRGSNGFGSSGV